MRAGNASDSFDVQEVPTGTGLYFDAGGGWDPTSLIDPKGAIVQSWHPVKVPGHAQAVYDALKAAQAK